MLQLQEQRGHLPSSHPLQYEATDPGADVDERRPSDHFLKTQRIIFQFVFVFPRGVSARV